MTEPYNVTVKELIKVLGRFPEDAIVMHVGELYCHPVNFLTYSKNANLVVLDDDYRAQKMITKRIA